MSAEDRAKIQGEAEEGLHGDTPTDLAGMKQLAETLRDAADEIVNDFEENRGNLEGGLLEHWEENTGFKSDGWESAKDDLDTVVSELGEAEGDEDWDGDLQEFFTRLEEAWAQGADQ